MKVEIPDNSILEMRQKRAELLQELFESDNLLLPETIFQMVMQIRNLSKTLSFIDERKIKEKH